jgi:hypothetical protein
VEATNLSQIVEYKTESGEVLVSAGITDLYFFFGNVVAEACKGIGDDPSLARIEAYKGIAKAFNDEFKCNLSWSQVWDLSIQVEEMFESLKKNSSSTST